VSRFKLQDPGEGWDGVYEKSLTDGGC